MPGGAFGVDQLSSARVRTFPSSQNGGDSTNSSSQHGEWIESSFRNASAQSDSVYHLASVEQFLDSMRNSAPSMGLPSSSWDSAALSTTITAADLNPAALEKLRAAGHVVSPSEPLLDLRDISMGSRVSPGGARPGVVDSQSLTVGPRAASSRFCFRCGDCCHLANNCPKRGTVPDGDFGHQMPHTHPLPHSHPPSLGTSPTNQLGPLPGRYCFKCKDPGHLADRCPLYPRRCFRCGDVRHTADRCPSQWCQRCGVPSHPAGYCPYAPPFCTRCGDPNHHTEICPHQPAFCVRCGDSSHLADRCFRAPRCCFKCMQPGHLADRCPDSTRFCFRCGDPTHLADSCPFYPGYFCFKCGEPSHLAARCPYHPRYCYRCGDCMHLADKCPRSPRFCHKCGSSSHLADRCPHQRGRCFRCGDPSHFAPECPITIQQRWLRQHGGASATPGITPGALFTAAQAAVAAAQAAASGESQSAKFAGSASVSPSPGMTPHALSPSPMHGNGTGAEGRNYESDSYGSISSSPTGSSSSALNRRSPTPMMSGRAHGLTPSQDPLQSLRGIWSHATGLAQTPTPISSRGQGHVSPALTDSATFGSASTSPLPPHFHAPHSAIDDSTVLHPSSKRVSLILDTSHLDVPSATNGDLSHVIADPGDFLSNASHTRSGSVLSSISQEIGGPSLFSFFSRPSSQNSTRQRASRPPSQNSAAFVHTSSDANAMYPLLLSDHYLDSARGNGNMPSQSPPPHSDSASASSDSPIPRLDDSISLTHRSEHNHHPHSSPQTSSSSSQVIADRACKVCRLKVADSVCLPCRHMCVCQVCSDSCSKCPVCDVAILQCFQVLVEGKS
mmetsp:Transcript_32921/g.53433  ORF Transcript_32921/g.53433 Transcript_32921/m.53433 type:complete len:841 (-) Transcript_32921:264-2786(-)